MSRAKMKSGRMDRAWPVGIALFLGLFVLMNVVLVLVSLSRQPDLVTESYYEEGFNLREVAEKQAHADALGWQVAVSHHAEAAGAIVAVGIADRNGAPFDSVTGRVSLYRPSNSMLDIRDLPLSYVAPGSYRLRLPTPLENGAWQAVMSLERGRERFENRVPFFVAP